MTSLFLLIASMFIVAPQPMESSLTLRLLNDTDSAVAFTLITDERKFDVWLQPRATKDLYVEKNDNERVLILRIGGKSTDLLATPTRVLATRAFRPTDAQTSTVFVYVSGTLATIVDTKFICLGPGYWLPFEKNTKPDEDSTEIGKKIHDALKRMKIIDTTELTQH